MTMAEALIDLMRKQWVSPMMALHMLGCMSLAQRVSEWRASGIVIHDRWAKTPSGKRHKEYRIVGGKT